jgi:hypothetical protein
MTKRGKPMRRPLTLVEVGPRLSRRQACRALGPVVYAVRVGDLVKIGHTGELAHRITSLGASEVLAFMPGSYDDEQAFHRRLAGRAVQGS